VQNESDSAAILRRLLADYEREFTGEGDDLQDALNEAYEKGKAAGYNVFRVEHIFIAGDNPLSGYAVVLGGHH
jgi:hypothetical protein